MAIEDSIPRWARVLAVIGGAAVAAAAGVLIATEVGDEDTLSAVLSAVGVMELVLAVGHALARKLFDHSDERAIDRLRPELDGLAPGSWQGGQEDKGNRSDPDHRREDGHGVEGQPVLNR